MPTMASITVADGAASPANHVFTEETTNGRLASWNNEAAATLAGRERLTVEVVRPQSAAGAYRHSTIMQFPVLATVDGTQKVVRFIKAELTLHAAQDSTEQEKKDAIVMFANLLDNASFRTSVTKMQPYF